MTLGALLLSLALPSAPLSAPAIPDLPPAAVVASNTSPFAVSVDLKLSPPSLGERLSRSSTPPGPRPYFGARYYASNIGRFTTTDPAYTYRENILDPQRWNKYAYGRNNPFRYVDPNGEDIWDIANGTANAFGSNFWLGSGRQTGNADFATGQFVGDVASIVVGALEVTGGEAAAGTGAAAFGLGAVGTAGSGGVGSPVTVPVTIAGGGAVLLGGAMVVQGGTAAIAGSAHAGIYLAKKLNEETGQLRPKKERTLEGAQDQLEGIQKEQAGARKGERDKINSTKKSEQDLDKELRKIKSTDDLKNDK